MTTPDLTLHGYWRSSAAYRVRIALNLKKLDYRQATHDLRKGEQHAVAFREVAPQGLVPVLQYGDTVVAQSPAILEWLEERWPQPPLLPARPDDRAIVRAMMAMITCDVHPLNNLRILTALRAKLNATETQVKAWISRWIHEGFTALEALIVRHGGAFAFGDTPTFADCCLVPQVYSAERFQVDLSAYPRLTLIARSARSLPAFQRAHPELQPDADGAATETARSSSGE